MNPEINQGLDTESKPGGNADSKPDGTVADTRAETQPQSELSGQAASQPASQPQILTASQSQLQPQLQPQLQAASEPSIETQVVQSPVSPPVAPQIEPQVESAQVPEVKAEKPCRHEYVRIFQRRLKGLDRRLVSTRAYLPIGFKPADLGHLSEGYCFCTKCRTRLFPRRTTAEKAAARISNLQAKAGAGLAAFADAEDLNLQQLPELLESLPLSGDISEIDQDETEKASESHVDVHVEELELESVDVQDIEAEGVKLMDDEESCSLAGEEDI